MNKLLVSPSPHIHADISTKKIMRDVVIALLPATLVAVVFYGWAMLSVLTVSIISCVLIEYLITKYLLKRPKTIGDWSAVVTGLLLALNLPTTTPWWIVFIGALVAIGVAKMTFGGLGQNVFNPAIVGRVFLLISFPVQMTNWACPESFAEAWGFSGIDASTGATPLSLVKEAIAQGLPLEQVYAEHGISYLQIFLINIGGSVGEISAFALILGFVYLLARKVVKIHIPLSIILTVAVFSGIFWLIDPSQYTDPIFNILTGGILLGAFFMATDYVTSPMTTVGGIIFGVGIGLITMLIRYFGVYPEGMSFAILITNSVVPLINKLIHSKKFGRA